ncbi:flagellar P-ring protein precursor FlgI [Desulfobotulus alkaliphilus]|uniref:Flagellar P-ring protein n=1 Tax=Desulfobotulus alkaliphilus TaxID=622671 RepID=A0A562RTK3_9BACT|nr:flagellar basal body P-ring protein FlgI [Desulfobotulus alkaliphilus]TWI72388.1 flagellar P-ring protein precursor FlgI [Desulfobotulus alkaliphilus]
MAHDYTKKSIFFLLTLLVWVLVVPAHGARIKDMAAFQGVRSNQLLGYGIVVGLDGTGDRSSPLTTQALASMMDRMGISIDRNQINVRNVAAVMVTASLPPFARVGNKIDVTISSLGDAKSLAGGTLLLTPLKGVDGNVYGLAQGALALGGHGAEGAGAAQVKNHLLVGRIAGGATVERQLPFELNGRSSLTLSLYQPDFTTVIRMAEAINNALGKPLAMALDSGAVQIQVPEHLRNTIPMFIAGIEALEVNPDMPARIVVNEKTGTVVIGENVRISTVAVAHGNLSISVREMARVSQPEAFGEGETVVVPETEIDVDEEMAKVMLMGGGATIGELVRALNAIGVTPRDMISIFQTIKAAGALQADLEII